MVEALTFVSSQFISLWTETLLYGAYAVLYSICMYILVYRRQRGLGFNATMLCMASGLFFLSTVHLIVNFVRGVQAFTGSESPSDAYTAFGAPLSLAKQSIYVTIVMLADVLLIYRCYTVWGRCWKAIVAPVIILILGSTTGYITVYQFTVVEPGNEEGVFEGNLKIWATASYGFALLLNVLVTSLIAYRIWWHTRRVRAIIQGVDKARYDRALAMVIESGAIYSLSLMIMLIMYTLNTHGQRIVYDALAQIAGIMPTLIIVRIGLGIKPIRPSEDLETSHTLQFNNTSTVPDSRVMTRGRHSSGYTGDGEGNTPCDDRREYDLSLYRPTKSTSPHSPSPEGRD